MKLMLRLPSSLQAACARRHAKVHEEDADAQWHLVFCHALCKLHVRSAMHDFLMQKLCGGARCSVPLLPQTACRCMVAIVPTALIPLESTGVQ